MTPSPKQAFDKAKFYYDTYGRELEAARAESDKFRDSLDDLMNPPTVAATESECSDLLAIAQSATQFAQQKDQEATAANQDAVAAWQLSDSAWAYYWNQCPE